MKVPVDDISLSAILTALDYTLDWPEDAKEPQGIGEYSLTQLLNFWSGFDESKLIPIDDIAGSPAFAYPDALLCEVDVIRALIYEVQRLRKSMI